MKVENYGFVHFILKVFNLIPKIRRKSIMH